MRKDIVWNPHIDQNLKEKIHQPETKIEDYIIHNTCSLLMIVDICNR